MPQFKRFSNWPWLRPRPSVMVRVGIEPETLSSLKASCCLYERLFISGPAFVLYTAILFLLLLFSRHQTGLYAGLPTTPRSLAANSTLGFEKIFVLSRGPSWRVAGLQAAANYSGLEVQVPTQAPASEELIDIFMNGGSSGTHPRKGSAVAWIGHLRMLDHVIQSGTASALILEDDADWDIGILDQMAMISDGVRRFTATPADDGEPYGRSWDVVWIGHCGHRLEIPEMLSWIDSTVVSQDQYAGIGSDWNLAFEDGHRSVSGTPFTLCTFGYGVSRAGAIKLLPLIDHGEGVAFDLALNSACSNPENSLRCLTVHPEVFHHYVPPIEDGFSSEVNALSGDGQLSSDEALTRNMGTTNNLANSVRCRVLWQSACPGKSWPA